VGWVQFI